MSFEQHINTIICGDCLSVMKDWPDGCVELVVTDPPYGIGMDNNDNRGNTQRGNSLAKSKDYGIANWDSQPMSIEQQLDCVRVSKNQVFFGGNYFKLPPSSCWIVWDKDNGTNDYADCELIWTSFRSAVRKVKWKWHGMLQEPNHKKEARVHPTQKPLGVMKWILERYSKPDQLILDPFCGSGTTCLAAKMLGRRYIGIDISEDYVEIARKRLEAVETGVPVREQNKGQMPMFPVESDG